MLRSHGCFLLGKKQEGRDMTARNQAFGIFEGIMRVSRDKGDTQGGRYIYIYIYIVLEQGPSSSMTTMDNRVERGTRWGGCNVLYYFVFVSSCKQ
jgi:hypothetical protein